MEKMYVLKGLDCPNCAAKIEAEIGTLGGVSKSEVNLMKQMLTVEVDECVVSDVDKSIRLIVKSHEPDVEVSEYSSDESGETEGGIGKTAVRLAIGAVLFGAAICVYVFTDMHIYIKLALLVAAYIVLGADVLYKAARNIVRGRVFDENFLMSLSTIGAFAIGEYPEAAAVMLFYQVGEFFQDLAVGRSRKSIAELMNIRPDQAVVRRNGRLETVAPDEVAIGEIISVGPGERIPLDGHVEKGESTLDTRALTGESVPRSVRVGDEVLSGCVNQSGVLDIKVSRPYGESTVSRIIDLVENASGRKAPTENFITTFARYYTPVVVMLAVMLCVLPPLMLGGGWEEWIHRALVFLVISCPCALVISIPLTFFGGIGAASKHGVLIKGGNYLEALNAVDTVVFDKTGTLTKGVFEVTEVITEQNLTQDQVLEYAALAECRSSHPIARSIIKACGGEIDAAAVSEYEEIAGHGVCVKVGTMNIAAGSEELLKRMDVEYPRCDASATKVYVAVDGKYAGCIVISDEPKKDSKSAIEKLKKLGISKTVMLTGDNETIARNTSTQLGIDEYHAQLLPGSKVEKLEQIVAGRKNDGKVAFVGDGINDAPVLARADVGIAMGGLGSDAAIEAADVVLMTDEPSKLVEAIEIAKATKRIVIQNIVIALGIKGLFLILGAFGIAGMWEAVFGDVGVALIAVLNAMRIMKK